MSDEKKYKVIEYHKVLNDYVKLIDQIDKIRVTIDKDEVPIGIKGSVDLKVIETLHTIEEMYYHMKNVYYGIEDES